MWYWFVDWITYHCPCCCCNDTTSQVSKGFSEKDEDWGIGIDIDDDGSPSIESTKEEQALNITPSSTDTEQQEDPRKPSGWKVYSQANTESPSSIRSEPHYYRD